MERTGGRLIRVLVILLAVCGLVVGLGGAGVADELEQPRPALSADDAGEPAQAQEGALPEIEIDADDITMEAKIDSDGSATLRVIYTIRLDSDADTEAFEELQAEIESDPSSYLDSFRERMNRTVDAAETTTDREMAARGFSISTERNSQLQTELGEVTFQFEWAGFAAADDGTIRAGDAVDSLFLDDSESLEFRWPEGYGIQSSDPNPERTGDRLAVWRGPIDFDAGQPRLVLATGQSVTETPTDTGNGGDTGGDPDDSGGPGEPDDDDGAGFAVMPLAGVVGLLIASAAVALFVRRESGSEGQQPTAEGGETAGTTPPDELLSNEERVLQLLRQDRKSVV